jgi:hypothetical protein
MTMHTLKHIAIGIVSTMIFALAVRTGYQAEQEATH